MKGEGEQSEIVARMGTNEVGTKRDQVLQSEMRELGHRLKSRTSLIIRAD